MRFCFSFTIMRNLFCLLAIFFIKTASAQTYYLLVGTYTNMGSVTSAPPKDSTGSKGIGAGGCDRFSRHVAQGHAARNSPTWYVRRWPSFQSITNRPSASSANLVGCSPTNCLFRAAVSCVECADRLT